MDNCINWIRVIIGNVLSRRYHCGWCFVMIIRGFMRGSVIGGLVVWDREFIFAWGIIILLVFRCLDCLIIVVVFGWLFECRVIIFVGGVSFIFTLGRRSIIAWRLGFVCICLWSTVWESGGWGFVFYGEYLWPICWRIAYFLTDKY